MSSCWRYHCTTCDSQSNEDTKLDGVLREAWEKRHLIARVMDTTWLEVSVLGGHPRGVMNWLIEHRDHEVDLVSDYGDRELLPT